MKASKFKPGYLFVTFVSWAVLVALFKRGSYVANYQVIPLSSRKEPLVSSYPLLSGQIWRLGEHKGKVVLVNLWASWCGPCLEEIPALVKLDSELKQQGLEMLGVSMDEGDLTGVRHCMSRFRMNYPIALGAAERTYSLGVSLPGTLIFDKRGKLAFEMEGESDPVELKKLVRSLLNES